MADCVRENCRTIQILRAKLAVPMLRRGKDWNNKCILCDIPMNEDLTRLWISYDRFRNSRIWTADPKGLLQSLQPPKHSESSTRTSGSWGLLARVLKNSRVSPEANVAAHLWFWRINGCSMMVNSIQVIDANAALSRNSFFLVVEVMEQSVIINKTA